MVDYELATVLWRPSIRDLGWPCDQLPRTECGVSDMAKVESLGGEALQLSLLLLLLEPAP